VKSQENKSCLEHSEEKSGGRGLERGSVGMRKKPGENMISGRSSHRGGEERMRWETLGGVIKQ